MQLLQPVNKLVSRLRAPKPPPRRAVGSRILFTRGDELMTPAQTRGSFERAIERSLRRETNIEDDQLARAFAVATTAYACTNYRATTTAGIPLHVTDPAETVLEKSQLTYFLSVAPLVLANITRSLLLWGRFYARKRYNAAGYPTGLEWVNPLRVRDITVNRRIIGYEIETLDGSAYERVPVEQVVYAEDFDPRPDGNGLSRFEASWLPLNIQQNIATYAAAFFVNGAQPDGFLTFDEPLRDDELDDARREWKANFQGTRNAHRTAVMPAGARWSAMQGVPKDLAMDSLSNQEIAQICSVFEVDPVLVGLKDAADPLSSNNTYNSAEIAHIHRATLPLLKMVILPALNNQWVRTDFDKRDFYALTIDEANIPALAEANLVKADTAVTLSDSGVMTINEARQLVGQGELADGAYLVRKPADVLSMWTAGAITLNTVHQFTLGKTPLGLNGDVVLINGALYPANELMTVALANVKTATTPPPGFQPSPFGGSLPPPPGDSPQLPPPAPESQTTETPLSLPAPQSSVQRAGMAYELAIPLAGHQFAIYARRALSEYLATLGVDADWTPETEYRLTLATGQGTPAEIGTLLAGLDYGEARKVDVAAGGYSAAGNGIYWRIGSSDGLEALRASTGLVAGGMVQSPGVLLCTVSQPVDLSAAPADSYPLVLGAVCLYRNGEAYHHWTLRGLSKAQDKELKDWAHVVTRKGRDYAFRSEHLPNIVSAYVTLALEDDEPLDDVFAAARAMLAAPTVRAYDDTEAGFVENIAGLISDAQKGTISKAAFAGGMRASLRRYGLMAYRDGMNSTGYDPEAFNAKELEMFRDWQSRQSTYVSNFANEIYTQGITETEVLYRAGMWGRTSLGDIYYWGIVAGNGEERMLWELGEAEHCDVCPRLDGHVMTVSDWMTVGFRPRNHATPCRSNCKCSLTRTSRPITATAATLGVSPMRSLPADDPYGLYEEHDHAHESAMGTDDSAAAA